MPPKVSDVQAGSSKSGKAAKDAVDKVAKKGVEPAGIRKKSRKSKNPVGRGRSVSRVSGRSAGTVRGSGHVTKKLKRAKPSKSRSESQDGGSKKVKKVKRASKSKASVSKSGGGSKKVKRKKGKSKVSAVAKAGSSSSKAGVSGAKDKPEEEEVPPTVKNETEVENTGVASQIGGHNLRPRNQQNGLVIKKGRR